MKCLKALAILLCCYCTVAIGQNSPISLKIKSQKSAGKEFVSTNLFKTNPIKIRSTVLDNYVNNYEILSLNRDELKAVLSRGHDALELTLPFLEEEITVELVKSDIYADGFRVTTSESNDQAVPYTQGTYYHGVVKGSDKSVVALSLFDQEVIGVLQTLDHGNMVLGQFGKQSESDYVLYSEDDLKQKDGFECHTEDPAWDGAKLDEMRKILTEKVATVRADKCVKIYFELDYDLYKQKGSVAASTNFISGIFNSVQTLYANEGISVQMSEVHVWKSADSYGTSSTSSALTSFRNKRSTFNGDVAHLVSRGKPSNGGIAWVDVLCTSYGYAYSWINSTYKNFPTYSWTVNVITHETGHNLGSPHTHSCSWPGGPLDNCYTPEPSNGCSPGPTPTNGGTIMSYCHLKSYGINYANGFGRKPGDLIRSRVNGAGCLSSCGGSTNPATCSDGIQNGTETGVDCGGTCTPCATCNDGIKNGDETAVDCGGSCDPCTSCNDGVKNGNETGIDCGGSCAPCVTCNDGVKNGDETGIDCGGSCGPCTTDPYCASVSNNTQYEYINKVTFAGIKHSSGREGYGAFTAKTAQVKTNNSYNISVGVTYASSAYTEHMTVWIDWNGDKDFNDAGEKALATTGKTTISGSIKVPSNAVKGTTRMRVQLQWNKAITSSCATVSYGEVEDYSVNISGGGGATATCTDGIKNGNETGVDCGGSCTPCATCDDGIKNGNETAVDCGGSCAPCGTAGSYCQSKSTTTQYEYIKNVSLADLNNSSKGNGGYADFTSKQANVEQGKTYTLSLTPGYNGSPYAEFFHVYIDWNSDGDFTDASERVFTKSIKATTTTKITVPPTAKKGKTRMRVQMQWNKAPGGPCSIINYGEVEDYTINIGGGGSTPSCGDGVQNGNETGVDCGGGCNSCDTCNDGVKNGDETGVDCGGSCAPCTTCNDGVKNGDETGVDCGGSCGPCGVTTNYCNSAGNKTTYEWIKSVTFAGIDNQSGKDNGYKDFTNLSANVAKGGSYPITLKTGYTGTPYNEGWNVYIDFNQDGDFTDAGESALTLISKKQGTGTIKIPSNAKSGKTRMRIQMQWNKNTSSSCTNFSWGEVEDYTVNVGASGFITAQNINEQTAPFDVKIFPNPVSETLIVRPQFSRDGTVFVKLYNVVGKVIDQRYIRDEERFDVSNFKPGYYLIEFESGAETITKKFIKN